jgi:SAM-dependent methyltransferase
VVTSAYASGRGPGVITPDGCPVELYTLLPPGWAEADVISAVAKPGASVLELGAGAGRVTHCLLARGFNVVAVDESPEMLDRIRGADTVASRIEDLDLRREFDVVVLGSHLVNVPDDEAVRALLAGRRSGSTPSTIWTWSATGSATRSATSAVTTTTSSVQR